MNKLTTLTIGLAVSALSLACVINDDDGGGVDTETGGTSPTTMSTTNTMTTSMTTTTAGDSTGGGMTMGQTGDDTMGATEGATEGDSGTTAVDPGPFVDGDVDPTAYTRVDRLGMPGVSTAFIPTDNKDAYNNASPPDDNDLDFQGDINVTVNFLLEALEDDLATATLEPCPTPNQCANDQLRPQIIPDTLKVNLNATAGFPNGRMLPDPVIDIVLALTLLDLTAPPDEQNVLTFVNLPLNPPANDEDFLADFPFLAPAH